MAAGPHPHRELTPQALLWCTVAAASRSAVGTAILFLGVGGFRANDHRMYSAVLIIHSWMRWVTLIVALAATINAARPPTRLPDGSGRLRGRWWDIGFMLVVDLQMLFGFMLYFGLSPFTKEAMNDMRVAMATPALRFWAVEHVAGMVIAAVLVRVGRVLAASAKSPGAARDRRLVCFILATIGMLASIPWPGFPNGRPLFRIGN